jgi:Leucine-rich repeat (LRR) protein
MKIIKIVLISLLLIAINSCRKEDDILIDNNRKYTPEIIKEDYGQGRVVGFAKDRAGNALSNVRVYFGEHTSITNGEGKFELTQVSKGLKKRIWFEKEGYAKTQKLINVSEDLPNRVDATLFNIEKTAKLTDEGGKIEGDDFSVEIEPGGFVYPDGEVVEGEVTVSVTPFLISDENFIDAFPGEFRGTREDGSETAIESFGFINVDLQDENGEPVQLADGVKANIQIKAPSNSPSTIPMWYYDFKKAQWIEEGSGSFANGIYTATVNHFTPWNWDKPVELRAKIIGKVVDNDGNPIEGANLVQTAKNRRFQLSTKSEEDGTFEMFTLENLDVEIEAQFDIYGSVVIDYTTSGSQLNDIGEIVIEISLDNVMPPIISNDILYITMNKVAKIRGSYFGIDKKQGYKLLLNGNEINTLTWQNDLIEFVVPNDIPAEGTIQLDRTGKSTQVNYKEGDWTCEINGVPYDNNNLPIKYNRFTLNFNGSGLTEIPSCIENLNSLEVLKLYFNQLISLPESFSNLNNLVELNLSENELTSLPENFGNLNNLQELSLSINQLTSLPENFGNLDNLQELSLSINQLTSLPESFGNLINLDRLGLEFNKLTSLPESFGYLKYLKDLSLNENQLTKLPESFGNMNNLKYLHLEGNQLNILPESIGNLNNLEKLNLEENKLTSLPESIGNLNNLEKLYLEGNKLTSLPESIGNLNNLEWLFLEGNQLSTLPESIKNLKNTLEYLSLVGNPISEVEKAKIKSWLPNTNIDWE